MNETRDNEEAIWAGPITAVAGAVHEIGPAVLAQPNWI